MGGASGLVGGLRQATGQEWMLSLERMRRIERIDPVSRIAVVEAGVVLQTLQEAAAAQGLLFPVDLGARGSATVGGLVSTNAGGERVLRFGMMREQVLGLEVVLADGTVLDLMGEVLKNNAGYDLKQLFIGSEGTLGIVTRAVLRLRPAFAGHDAAWLALADLAQLPQALTRLERGLGGTLSAFELMWPEFLHTMTAPPDTPHRMPLAPGAAGYVLVEAEGGTPDADHQRFIAVLEDLLEDGTIADAAIARSEAERRAFWAIRNDIPRLARHWSPSVSFDVSVPIAMMAGYVAELRAALTEAWPGARLLSFGHVADNNLHLVVNIGADPKPQADAIAECVYRGVLARHGSISAEHGIGLDKRHALHASRPPAVLALMRQMKASLDPMGLFNPGKVV
jgi:FAD/FMN-containing dehydrogenase